ncbi:hypothetical protein [Mucilaginibacter sp.]|uniref:hypothetical protein n=1 Tax=Mucilaginibacter sp. TaxID=1882438 RepID=UPI00262321FC|nr:hypothetical protein [Mucilaginibacter sp.]
MDQNSKKVNEVQTLLKFTYGLTPIVAGADKFTNILTDWAHYLNPSLRAALPVSDHVFMMTVGIIEIIAGILVFVNPKKGALLVSAWLVLIALNLIASVNYLDVAVRDLAMAVGAFSLSKLTGVVKSQKTLN